MCMCSNCARLEPAQYICVYICVNVYICVYISPSVYLYLAIHLHRSLEVYYLHVHVLKLGAVGAGAIHIYICMRACAYLSI